MSRARTPIKGSERFGVRHVGHSSLFVTEALTTWETNEAAARKRHAKCRAQKRACVFVRGTSVRLAPLVQLGPWETTEGGWHVLGDRAKRAAFIEIDRDEEGGCDAYEVDVFHNGRSTDDDHTILEGSTLEDAKRWAEKRLRFHGFKVAKGDS